MRVSEIFYSIQGEATTSGYPTVFVRLVGCPLRCVWCDTEYAFTGGAYATVEDIVREVKTYGCPRVCVTGGEPLSHGEDCKKLLAALCDAGLSVSLETSGALPISAIDRRVRIVMDIKCPGSGEKEKNHLINLQYLGPMDQLKFVIADHADFYWALAFLDNHQETDACEIFFSPVYGKLAPSELAQWILANKRHSVRLQVQLHKVLWGEERGR